MSVADFIRLELGMITDGDGNVPNDEAVVFFTGDDDCSCEIVVRAPFAPEIASRIVELWNAPEPK